MRLRYDWCIMFVERYVIAPNGRSTTFITRQFSLPIGRLNLLRKSLIPRSTL
jgi:hypothetical protein